MSTKQLMELVKQVFDGETFIEKFSANCVSVTFECTSVVPDDFWNPLECNDYIYHVLKSQHIALKSTWRHLSHLPEHNWGRRAGCDWVRCLVEAAPLHVPAPTSCRPAGKYKSFGTIWCVGCLTLTLYSWVVSKVTLVRANTSVTSIILLERH